jgi:hypothetical protein
MADNIREIEELLELLEYHENKSNNVADLLSLSLITQDKEHRF